MRTKGDTFFVNLTLATAVNYVKKGAQDEGVSNELVSEYGDLSIEQGFYVLVYEKYYMRSSNRASLTILLHKVENMVKVFCVGSGGGQGSIFSFDWGAADKFESIPRSVLNKYIID